jgi:tRNA U34 2-thiouridine synthase MnmA/TrmU
MMNMKALALLSGGLDSTLAVKLVQEQGIDVVGLNFTSPFCLCGEDEGGATGAAKQLGIPLRVIAVGDEYLKMLRNPKHGYGRNLNPCIDCRIFMLRKAKKYAEAIGASFLLTGEVLNERPMSQRRKALKIIEEEAGLEGQILRPLSARLLPKTVAEERGWVDRKKLLDIEGRSRKKQISLAAEFGVSNYPCPAGGCLLTCREFAAKMRDLFKHEKRVTIEDINLLRIGRHFRSGRNKIIVGRDETENAQLQRLKAKTDYLFEVPGCGSPITLLRGPTIETAIGIAAALTLRYSDKLEKRAPVHFGAEEMNKSVVASALTAAQIEELRVQ